MDEFGIFKEQFYDAFKNAYDYMERGEKYTAGVDIPYSDMVVSISSFISHFALDSNTIMFEIPAATLRQLRALIERVEVYDEFIGQSLDRHNSKILIECGIPDPVKYKQIPDVISTAIVDIFSFRLDIF